MSNNRARRLAVLTAALVTATTLGVAGCGDDGSNVRDDNGGSGSSSTGSGSASH